MSLNEIMTPVLNGIRDERLRLIAERARNQMQLREDMLEALRQCQAELASIHGLHGDRENAEAHSAGLRMANAVLSRIEAK